MNLTDTGNLVLFDDHNLVAWQSFHPPTDCLLPGQKLYKGQKLKSSNSSSNFSEGMFSLQVTNEGLFGYIESNPSEVYYRMDIIYDDTIKERKYIRFLNGSLSFFIHSSKPNNPDKVIGIQGVSPAQYIKLMPDGHLQVFEFQSHEWTMVSDVTSDAVEECDYPLRCGRYSICSTNEQCSCPGIEYFRPVNDRQPNLGCYEITPLTCNSKKEQHFVTLENVKYFTSIVDMKGVNVETCKQACLNNCSCKAAFFRYDTNVGIIVIGNPGPIGTNGLVTTNTITYEQPTTFTRVHDYDYELKRN
ncbi:putative non-specific serine/threonine protein kinase [Helianthus annuus]|nr:putative non-specific serine/threonine protein kinase [Helianthus annuus]